MNDCIKWNSKAQQSAWSEDQNKWESKLSHWTINNYSDNLNKSDKWCGLENQSSSSFFEGIDKIQSAFPPPPPKPDDSQNKSSRWHSSSIWSTPPKFDVSSL